MALLPTPIASLHGRRDPTPGDYIVWTLIGGGIAVAVTGTLIVILRSLLRNRSRVTETGVVSRAWLSHIDRDEHH